MPLSFANCSCACCVGHVEQVVILMDRAPDFAVQFLQLAQYLQRVEQPGVRAMHVVPHHRDTLELDIRGLVLAPAFHARVEPIAVRAAVPEHFDDLDHAWADVSGLGRGEDFVVRPGDPPASR